MPAHLGEAERRLDGIVLLIIEDHDHSRELLRESLEALGATVHDASDGQSALAWLATAPDTPDAILCDLRMPGMDGCEVAARLRQTVPWRRIPLIAVTAFGFSVDYHRAVVEAGFAARVDKPIRLAALVRAIQEVLRSTARRPPPAR
jgi:CheY-like chemotaxis protein